MAWRKRVWRGNGQCWGRLYRGKMRTMRGRVAQERRVLATTISEVSPGSRWYFSAKRAREVAVGSAWTRVRIMMRRGGKPKSLRMKKVARGPRVSWRAAVMRRRGRLMRLARLARESMKPMQRRERGVVAWPRRRTESVMGVGRGRARRNTARPARVARMLGFEAVMARSFSEYLRWKRKTP